MEESHKEAQMITCRGLEKETIFVSSHLVLKKNNNGRSPLKSLFCAHCQSTLPIHVDKVMSNTKRLD
jgi:hypothetical protein